MKKILRLLIFAIGGLLFSSCAVQNGYLNNSTSLSQANFRYAKTSISGTASTLHVLGIGGLRKSAIIDEAKRNMLKRAPLKQNQALANTTVTWKSSFYFVVILTECTITADIVEFYSENKSPEMTKAIDRNESNIENSIENIVINKDLVFEKGYKGIVELGYQIGVGYYGLNRLKLDIIKSYQINEYFSTGFGTGLRYYGNQILFPIYADFRANYNGFNLNNNKIVPYFSLGMGYSLALDTYNNGGLIIKPDIGISLKISEKSAMNIGLGYEMQKVSYYRGYLESINIGDFSISVGISF